MAESEVFRLLGEPKTKSSENFAGGIVVETWSYRYLVKEWREIQHTDIETIQRLNALTGLMEEVVVPIESTVTRTIHQNLTIKIMDGKVLSLDSKMEGDVLEALN